MIVLSAAVIISLVCYACYKWDIKKRIHLHEFDTPIVSMYVSFHCRDIVYQCKCGEGRITRVCLPFGKSFDIETTIGITQKELKQIANENEVASLF
jgi:hypothetical protein